MKPKSGVESGRYYEVHKEGRGKYNAQFVVRVWPGDTKTGEPSHEWEMPGILGEAASVAQAIVQSK